MGVSFDNYVKVNYDYVFPMLPYTRLIGVYVLVRL